MELVAGRPPLAPLARGPAGPYPELAIRTVEASVLDIPSIRAHRLSGTEMTSKSFVLVRVRLDNGVEGVGEAAVLGGPRWAEESVESIRSVVVGYLAPALVGHPAHAFEANARRMANAAKRNGAARAAVESALIDAVGRSWGRPATDLLGGAVRDSFGVIWALASGDVGQEIEEATEKLRRREHRDFKVKIGFAAPATDLDRLARLRAALGEDVRLIVDVNQGWSEATAIRWLPALAELGVGLVEQPVPAGQLEAMARLAARSPVPLLVDEAAFGLDEIARAATLGAGSVLSLKLVKSGGLFELKRAAGVASAHGMEHYGGCLLEGSVGTAAHLAVFATLPELAWGTEHFGPRLLTGDIVIEPLVYEDFEVRPPSGSGLGVTLNEDRVRAWSRRD